MLEPFITLFSILWDIGVLAQCVDQYSENKCKGAVSSLLRKIRGDWPSVSNLVKLLSIQVGSFEYIGELKLLVTLLRAPSLSTAE